MLPRSHTGLQVVLMNLTAALRRLLPQDAESRAARGRFAQFAGLEFLFWFATANTNYLTVFLQNMGFSASRVGVVTAACSSVGIVSTLFWGTFSDRIRSVRKSFLLCTAGGALFWALVPSLAPVMVGSLSMSLVAILLSMFFRAPSGALLDNWLVVTANREGLNYGSIRSFGSFSFAIMGIGLSFLLGRIGVSSSFVIYGIVCLPLLALTFFVRGDAQKSKALTWRELRVGRLLRDYRYVTFLAFAVLMQMPINTMFGFLSFLIDAVHGDRSQLGMIHGYKALLEIPMLLLMAPLLRRKVSFPKMAMGAAVFFALEAFLFGMAHTFWQLVAISTLHGLGGGLLIAAASNYIYTLAPDELKASAQTIYVSAVTVAGIVGNLLGGVLIDRIGVQTFALWVSAAVLVAVGYYAVAQWVGRRNHDVPSPQQL